MDTVKVGVIGAGAIARNHCDGIKAHARGEVTAVADISAARAGEIKERYGLKHVFSNYKDLIACSDVDAVTIALPNALHAPVAIAALRAGKHVLLEKPFVLNQREGQKVIEAARAARRVCMVGMNQRFLRDSQTIRALVARGELGDIYHAKAYWARRSGSPKFGTWFTQKKLAGGGAMLDIGVHMLDLCLHLMDNWKPVSVSGAVYTKFGNRGLGEGGWGKSDPGKPVFDVDDMATALIKMRNGATVCLDASWARHQADANRNNVELFGTEAGAGAYPATLYRFGKVKGEYEVVHPQGVGIAFPHCNRMVHWLDVIVGQAKPMCTLTQAMVVQKILDGVYLSARTGKEVRIS